jgi:peroxiredoxin
MIVKNSYMYMHIGVDAIYCLSVNDRFVMKSWGDATSGFAASGVQLVADGEIIILSICVCISIHVYMYIYM